jgi:hypothetical protein
LRKRIVLTEIAQELKETQVPWQVALADPTKHPQIRLEQGKETLRSVLMHVPTRVFLLRMIHELMHVAFQCSIAAGRVGVEPTTRLHGQAGSLLDRLDREIFGRVEDDLPLAD